jgi:HlyD family secretion protein
VKRGIGAAAAAVLAAMLAWALMPQPVDVELGKAEMKPLRVTVDEEGKTRIRDVFVITAPIAGTMRRSPLKVGDAVVKNDTVVAVIMPPSPTFRDFRTSLELESIVKSCEANVELAEAELRQAQADLQLAKSEQARARTLADRGVAPTRVLERADADLKIKEAAVTRAKASIDVRKRELDNARIRQMGPEEPAVRQGTTGACSFDVRSPESGQVLKLIAESEQPIAMGAPVMEIGNPANLELVVDLLSSDAVKVAVGANATVVD